MARRIGGGSGTFEEFRMRKSIAVAFAFIAAGIAGASAQNYPDRSIKVVVPYPAGGPTDTIARTVTQGLTATLGQTVVIENQSGAGGRIAMKQVANAAPDGYTLFMGGTNNNAITPAVYKDLDIDGVKDFAPAATVAIDLLGLVVHPSVPVKTLAELAAYAKANPGKLTSGGGVGISPHFLLEFVRVKSGANIVFVPYKGAAPALTDAIAGQIQMHATAKSVILPQIQAGKLRALAVQGTKRWPELPDVPTLTEAGFDGFPPALWYGFLAPAKTPPAVIARLNVAVNQQVKTPEVQAAFAKLGIETRSLTPQEFGEVLVKERDLWAALAQQTGIKLAD
jgi:tripartite-type tricarboxylate transporter receptor subunit TctC